MKVPVPFVILSMKIYAVLACPSRCTCGYHNGDHPMDCSSQGLTEIDLDIPEWTTSMRMDGNQLTAFDLNFCEVCTYFEKISLRYNRISRIIAHRNNSGNVITERNPFCINIAHVFPRLWHLHLRGNMVHALPKCLLFALPALKYLNLNDNQIRNIRHLNLISYQSHTYSLEEVHVKGNGITQLLKRDLYTSAIALRKLRVLDLSGNRIHTIEGGVFTFFDGLKELRLGENKIGFLADFSFVTKGESLEIIELRNNYIDWISARAFAGLPKLKILDLKGNDIQCLSPDRWSTCQFMTLPLSDSQIILPINEDMKHFSRFKVKFLSPVRVELVQNPLRCDCKLYNLFTLSNLTAGVPGLRTLTCSTPDAYHDQPAIDVINSLDCMEI